MSKQYNDYIIEHVENVKKAFKFLKDNKIITDKDCNLSAAEKQIAQHDMSKWTDAEYDAYDKYFYGEKTQKVKDDFDLAWLHHQHANPHHWQHWVLVQDDDGDKALEMPRETAVEMLCDWMSFSFKIDKLEEVLGWYDAHRKTMILNKETKKFVEDVLDKYKKFIKEQK